MKKTNINLMGIAFNALLCVCLALPASAQHREGGNRGGGSAPASAPRSAPSNGGGGQQSRPSYNGGGAAQSRQSYNGGVGQQSRPSYNNNNGGRRNYSAPASAQRSAVSQPRVSSPRQGISPGQRGVSASVQLGLSARPAYQGGSPGYGAVRVSGGRRPYAGYYNAHGYYNSFYAPHLGFRLNVLPYGYYPFYFGDNQYFYSDGLYYQYDNNQYSVVEPPVGAAINTLPDNAQSIMINGIQYYELNGVYYQPYTKDDGTVVYQVAGKDGELNTDPNAGNQAAAAPPQIGDMFTNLPDGTRTIKINGQKIYVSPDDYYYQDAKDNNNNSVYKIVGTPSDEPNQ